MIEVVLVRHGVQSDGRLSRHGTHQIGKMAEMFARGGITPDLILTSRRPYAVETCRRLAPGLEAVPLDALTPDSRPEAIDVVVDELEELGEDLREHATVVMVGHEGRLSNMLTELTCARFRPLRHGEAVIIRAAEPEDLLTGRATVRCRLPVVNHQESPLREKLKSKSTVSVLLAGFVFTSLSAVLLLANDPWKWHRVVACTALTAALGLLLASVYAYDQLSTPEGFWTDARRPRLWRRFYACRERKLEKKWERIARAVNEVHADEATAAERLDGPIYVHMVGVSRWLFNPAVLLGVVGFVALLIGTDRLVVVCFSGAALVLTLAFAAWRRPDLGAD